MELLARTCKTESMNFQRILARLFVLLGIVYTFYMGFGAHWAYIGQPLGVAVGYGMFFAAGLIIVFVLGLFYEMIAALLLLLGAVGVVVWGLLAGWGAGSWGAMAFVIIEGAEDGA